MADGDDTSPFGTTPQVAAVGPAPVIEAPMTNPEGARNMGLGFLAKHRADFDARTREVDNVFSKQQMNVDTMSRLLDDTTAALKKNREGRSNLGLMALGAGMMSSPGNFGTQIGAGVKAMIPAIQQERGDEQDYQLKLAQLAMRRAGIENAPLQDKLAYLRALQVGDEASMRAIEAGLIKVEGQTEKAGAKTDQAAATLEERANKHAMDAAQKQVDALAKDNFTEPGQREAELIRRYEMIARSMKVPEESIKKFSDGLRTSIEANKPKGGFNVPGDKPEDIQKAKQLGLPPLTAPSSYASAPNPTDRLKMYPAEKAAYDKEKKLFDADADKAAQELAGLAQAEAILKTKAGRDATGPQYGLPNSYFPDRSNEAQQLDSIFSNNTIHSVPQGQGAISDYERSLFNKANPSMAHRADVNLALIAQRRRILEDQITKAKFINTYFNHYKTSAGANDAWKEYAKSNEGMAYIIDEKGKLVDNPNRISVQDYMRKRHGDGMAEGGQFNGGGQVPGYAGGGLTFLGTNPLNMDKNYWRTVAQVIPYADEAVAGVRSILPTAIGGTDYDTALKDERQGVKDFTEKHGEGAALAAQLGGGLLTLPFGGAAGAALKALPGAAKVANVVGNVASKVTPSWLANSPTALSILGALGKGAGVGAVQGFGAGEGGFDERMHDATMMGLIGGGLGGGTWGAIRTAQGLKNLFSKDDRVAKWFRKELPSDRVSAYDADPSFNALRNKAGTIDTSHPNFANMSADELKDALQKKRNLSMDQAQQGPVMPGSPPLNPGGKDIKVADVLPGMTEAAVQMPGEQAGRLSKDLIKRQHDPTLPLDQQGPASHYGQVKDWFGKTFGTADFRGTEAQLLNKLETEADAMFQPAYSQRIMSLPIDDAMERIKKLAPDLIEQAETSAAAARGGPRDTGLKNRHGEYLNYNTQFLHDIKRLLDKRTKDPTFDTMTAMHAKSDLNKAMMDVNPEYKAAMERYGDTSTHIDALRSGREDIFGKNVNELDKGIGRQDIDAFLNDPSKSLTEKYLYRIGGARALESKLLGSDATKFTHNWAEAMSNPNMMEKYEALLPPGKQAEWPQIVEQLRQLSDQNKLMNSALGNSKTAKRLQSIENMDDSGSSILSNIVGSAVNPSAPSGYRKWIDVLTHPVPRRRAVANEAAGILGRSGQAGNESGVEEIRRLLSQYQGREAGWNARKSSWPAYPAYLYPDRTRTRSDE